MGNRPRTGQWLWFEPIYRFNVALICCPPDQARARIARVLPSDVVLEMGPHLETLGCDGRFVGGRHGTSGLVALFWFSPNADVAVIAHEALHGACYVLREKGLRLDDSSEEAFTYFTEWLVREITRRRDRAVSERKESGA